MYIMQHTQTHKENIRNCVFFNEYTYIKCFFKIICALSLEQRLNISCVLFFFLLILSRPDITVIIGDKRLHTYVYVRMYILTDRRHSRCCCCCCRRPRHCGHYSINDSLFSPNVLFVLFQMYVLCTKCSSLNCDDDYYEDDDQLWIKYSKLSVNVMHQYYN